MIPFMHYLIKSTKIIIFCVLFMNFQSIFADHPFSYDLHLKVKPGNSDRVMIMAHGMGGDYRIQEFIPVKDTLVSFNFPDYSYGFRTIEAKKTTFGTIQELLPLLYVIKTVVIDQSHSKVDLYGFSAGGGAIINAIGVLNTNRFDNELQTIGINQNEKVILLDVIQKGIIILEVPLKSIQEIIDYRKGNNQDLIVMQKRYQLNDMEPIYSLKYLKGLVLNIIVYFQNPDEVLSNRDDQMFYNQLKEINANGTTKLIIGHGGGHVSTHPELWKYYFATFKR
ncbi:MAG: hypothetical protein Q8K60_08175 [Parachlamydiaceae bacterium]|nr:hypothetical protein [Parachlamydiaceae bacterium]